jgi:membrane fusion protein (multidrug efflux system)
MKRILRRLITLSIIAALGVGGYFLGRSYLFPPRDFRTINVVGMLEAPEVNITSRIGGRIAEITPLEGDHVEKGEVVCKIEDVDLKNQLLKARADLQVAQANLESAQLGWNRNRALFQQKIISTQQYDDARILLAQDEAAVASADANVHFYADQVADTNIRAPIDGIIINKALEIGEWVTPGTTILTVDDLSTVWARVDVQETDLGWLAIGTPARVNLPTDPPLTLKGEVMAIGQEGEFATEHDVRRGQQDIRTFYVKVRVLEATGDLKPGMTAEVSFQRDVKRRRHFFSHQG